MYDKNLTNKEITDLRLHCLRMIVDGGSHIDRANPAEKAEKYFQFVVGTYSSPPASQEPPKPKKKAGRPPKKKPIEDTVTEPVNIPFDDSGREKVLL